MLLRLYVPFGVPCRGSSEEIFTSQTPGVFYSIISSHRAIRDGEERTQSAVAKGNVFVSWKHSNHSSLPAELDLLQTDDRIEVAQVYFCSACWLRAQVMSPVELVQMNSVEHVLYQHCSLNMFAHGTVSSEDYWAISLVRNLMIYPVSVLVSVHCCTLSLGGTKANEWFSMTIEMIRRRYSGYIAFSQASRHKEQTSMMYEAVTSAVLSYAAAWYLAALVPTAFPFTRDQIDETFQQIHDWLHW